MTVYRNNLTRDHLRSPYSRNGSSGQRNPPKTPGSIFRRVKRMFSPGAWTSDNESSADDTDASVLSDFASKSLINNTPTNPINEFDRLQHETVFDSPNVRLAKFFTQKGSEPLSEIELEGVKALLQKAGSQQSQSSSIHVPLTPDHETSKVEILKSEAKTSSVSSTPSFKAKYNTTSVVDGSTANTNSRLSNVVHKRRVFDYSGFPSPFRTSRLKSSIFSLELEDSTKVKDKNTEPPKEEKKLSNTANALLSFIESHEAKEEQQKVKIQKDPLSKEEKVNPHSYSNPYALPSISNRKIKKQNRVTNAQPEILSQLEKSLAKDSPKPEKLFVVKNKPKVSSSLRQSITLEDESDDSKISETESDLTKESDQMDIENKDADVKEITTTDTEDKIIPDEAPFMLPKESSKPLFAFKPREEEEEQQEKPKFTFNAPSAITTTTAEVPNSSALTINSPKLLDSSLTKSIQKPFQTSNFGNGVGEYHSIFKFPDAQRSNYKLQDSDDSRVAYFKTLIAF